MKRVFRISALAFSFLIPVVALTPAFAGGKPQHQAKIAMVNARATALARAPGTIVAEELEHEHGRWIYSFEIRPQGEKGKVITEVNVDADSGVIVDVQTEND